MSGHEGSVPVPAGESGGGEILISKDKMNWLQKYLYDISNTLGLHKGGFIYNILHEEVSGRNFFEYAGIIGKNSMALAAAENPVPGARMIWQGAASALNGWYQGQASALKAVPDNVGKPGFWRGSTRGYLGSVAGTIVPGAGDTFADATFGPMRNDAENSGLVFYRTTELIAGVAVGGVIAARTVVGRLGAVGVESGVWKLNPLQRGQQIEQALGLNLPGNFPVIDRFENGLATSIKSLDLNAAAYQSTSTLSRTLSGYVDKVARFQGRTWAGVRIRSQDITGRALDLAVPHSGSVAQQAIINQAVTYGASRGVTVNVIPFP
jgi:hypothetical protein